MYSSLDGFARRVHAMFEHLEPRLSIGFAVNIQLSYYLAPELYAAQAARRDYFLISDSKLISVKFFVFVIRNHRLQVLLRVTCVTTFARQSRSGDCQRCAADSSDRHLPRVQVAKKNGDFLIRILGSGSNTGEKVNSLAWFHSNACTVAATTLRAMASPKMANNVTFVLTADGAAVRTHNRMAIRRQSANKSYAPITSAVPYAV